MNETVLLRFLESGLINVGGDDTKLEKLHATAAVESKLRIPRAADLLGYRRLSPYPYPLPPRPANYFLMPTISNFYAGKTPQFSFMVSPLASVGTPRRISFGRK
jgi:hypothetical protein